MVTDSTAEMVETSDEAGLIGEMESQPELHPVMDRIQLLRIVEALLFASGVDFTADGAGYVCTIHGDVWRVTSIDAGLQSLHWKRVASGLFQPLGLKVIDGDKLSLSHEMSSLSQTNLSI